MLLFYDKNGYGNASQGNVIHHGLSWVMNVGEEDDRSVQRVQEQPEETPDSSEL